MARDGPFSTRREFLVLLSLWPRLPGLSRRPGGGRRNRFAAQLGIVVRDVDHCVSALVVSRAVYGLDYPVILSGIKTFLDGIAHRRAERFEFLGLMVDGAVNGEGAPRPSTGRLPGSLDEDPAVCHGGKPQVASGKYALIFHLVESFALRSVALLLLLRALSLGRRYVPATPDWP
jgi:hypothetical protein